MHVSVVDKITLHTKSGNLPNKFDNGEGPRAGGGGGLGGSRSIF